MPRPRYPSPKRRDPADERLPLDTLCVVIPRQSILRPGSHHNWSVGAIRFPETVSRQGMGSTPVGVTTRCSMSGAIPDPLGEGGTAFPPR